MPPRSRSSREIEWIAKRSGAVLAVFAAAAALVKLLGGPTGVLLVLGVIAVVGAVADWVLKGRQHSVEVREGAEALLLEPPARVSDLAATEAFYRLGVETEAREALEAAGQGDRKHAMYVERDIDERRLRPALRAAATTNAASLIVVRGPSKVGKSRTLLEATAAAVPHAWLLAPQDAAALGKLARGTPPRRTADEKYVIWLDDIEPFVRPGGQGLSEHTLRALEDWNRPVLVLGTAGGKGQMLAGADAMRFADPISNLLRGHEVIDLASTLSVDEQTRLIAAADYLPEAASRIAAQGIGEFMIAAQRLVEWLSHTGQPAEGVAVTRAAIDWRRAGLLRPVSAESLQALFGAYVNGPATPARFEQGVLWAVKPLYAHVAPLQGNDPYDAYDYLVEHADRIGTPIAPSTWDAVIDKHADTDELAGPVGVAAWRRNDFERAERAFRRADEGGHARAAFHLGLLLASRGDDEGAEDAFRRAHEHGDADGSVMLGSLLEARGDESRAEEVYRQADERGHTRGLGAFLERRGDENAAEGVYRRADEHGDPEAALMLGLLLKRRGDERGAANAFRRADERGSAEAAYRLGVLLGERRDITGAEAAYRRADRRGHAAAAFNLGILLRERRDNDGARSAYQRADERGHPGAASNLGVLLARAGDEAGAEAAFRRADDRGVPDGAFNLGLLLDRRHDAANAEDALRRADKRGHGGGSFMLGFVLERRGDLAGAAAAYRRATKSTDRDIATKATDALASLGR